MKTDKIVLSSSLLLTGFTAIVGQVILIRELLITFSGNELSIGIFFANLLLLEALGSYAASRRIERSHTITLKFILLQNLLSGSLPLVIFLIRTIRTAMGILPGESINMLVLFLCSLFLLLPFGTLNGALFSHACRLLSEGQEKNNLIAGKVYVLEALGSVAGGITVTYLALKYLSSFQTAHLLFIFTLLTGFFLLNLSDSSKKNITGKTSKIGQIIIVVLFFISSILLLSPLNDYLQKKSIQWQWKGYQVLSYKNSIYGNVSLLKQMDQYILLSNSIPMASFPTPDIAFNEDFVHIPFLFHKSAENILLIGGGSDGIIGEILKHPVQKLDYAELDPLLLETVLKYVPEKDWQDLSDPRIKIHFTDGRFFLRQSKEKYDLIFLNLPDPASLEINRFYTTGFFRMCKERLAEKGLVVFLVPGSSTYLNRELLNLNACLLKTAQQVFRGVMVIPDESSLYLATEDTTLPDRTIEKNIEEFMLQNIDTRMITPTYLKYKLSAQVRERFQDQVTVPGDIRINTDLVPAALYYCLAYHNSIHSPRFAVFFQKMQNSLSDLLLIFLFLILAFICWKQRSSPGWKKTFIILPVIGSGFIGMGIPVVFVLLFQSLFGYVYFWIGLLVTSFMSGLAAGSWWINHRLNKINNESKWFIVLLVLLAGYLLLIILLLIGFKFWDPRFFSRPGLEFIFLLSSAICGGLVGAQFPIANKIYLAGDSALSKTAGILYAADLIGAWMGGLIVTAWIIPVHGIIYTLSVFLTLNILALIFFTLAKK